MFAARARLLITTLWAGSLWTVGYMVAPTLFATLNDKVLAGSIAGSLFQIEAWLSLFCGILLATLAARDRNDKAGRQLLWIVAGMLVCTAIGYFALHPYMASIKAAAGPGGMMTADARTQFGILHGVSSAFYLVQSLLGIALVLTVQNG